MGCLWIELTKDVMAFANTRGGYLVFGVEDATHRAVGVEQAVSISLSNADMVQQKVNRFCEPAIQSLRAKAFVVEGKLLVVWHISRSHGKTHVVLKDAVHKSQSGQDKTLLHKGTMYVRRIGGNRLADSRDIDDVVTRRLDDFKNTLLSKIARVVEAPADSEVVVLSRDPADMSGKKYIISDAPDAIAVKGMSFTVSPETIEQEVASWMALLHESSVECPPDRDLWRWYRHRETLVLNNKQKEAILWFSLLRELPPFYWMKDLSAAVIKPILVEALLATAMGKQEHIMRVAAFLGPKFFNSLVHKFRDPKRHLSHNFRTFPKAGPRSYWGNDLIVSLRNTRFKGHHEQLNEYLHAELERMSAQSSAQAKKSLSLDDKWYADAYDCCLYARDDKYSEGGGESES